MTEFSWGVLLGGLAFFFFGLHSVRNGLQLLAGDRLRNLLLHLTDHRLKAFGFGAFMTLILQSSGATTALMVGLAGAQLLTLRQAFAVILGADVGATAVIFLLAARQVTDIALLVVAFGLLLYLGTKARRWRYIGEILFGFGFVFYGMVLTIQAMEPIKDSLLIRDLFATLNSSPLWSIAAAAVFTGLVRSSAATLGLALSLAFSGALTLEGALPLVLGANIGTTASAWLAAIGSDINAKRVAAAHVFSKIGGVIVAIPLLHVATDLLTRVAPFFYVGGNGGGLLGFQIALAHLGFNILVALLFLPFLHLGTAFITRMLPEPSREAQPFGARYLDPEGLNTPALAFAQAAREVLRVANLSHDLFQLSLQAFDHNNDIYQMSDRVAVFDDQIDCLEREIRFFLARLSQEQLTDVQASTQVALVEIAADFESIGDVISKEMILLARKKHDKRQLFSDEGWMELTDYHAQLSKLFTVVIGYLATRDVALATEAENQGQALLALDAQLRPAHLRRLHHGVKVSVETSSIHLDLLGNYRTINLKLAHIVQQCRKLG